MDYSVAIVALLCDYPGWSNSAIARRIGCEQRRVRRYRRCLTRALAKKGASPERIRALEAPELRTLLNVRAALDTPDFEALRAAHPYATAKALWRAYVDAEAGQGRRAMSYSNFMRHHDEWLLCTGRWPGC